MLLIKTLLPSEMHKPVAVQSISPVCIQDNVSGISNRLRLLHSFLTYIKLSIYLKLFLCLLESWKVIFQSMAPKNLKICKAVIIIYCIQWPAKSNLMQTNQWYVYKWFREFFENLWHLSFYPLSLRSKLVPVILFPNDAFFWGRRIKLKWMPSNLQM